MTDEPYWVRYHRENQAQEAAHRAARNTPPPKSAAAVPLLFWARTVYWWPKREWERREVRSNDLALAAKGYELREIRDVAVFDRGQDGIGVTSVEASYSPHLTEHLPQQCGYIVTFKADTPDEEVLCEDGFANIAEARKAASQALAAILQRRA
jgi:hypothetical protein